MSDDDRAAKAARAKALVRVASSITIDEVHLTSPPFSLTRRDSRRNLVLIRHQVRALVQPRQQRQHQARLW
jgi:hypothetical protein